MRRVSAARSRYQEFVGAGLKWHERHPGNDICEGGTVQPIGRHRCMAVEFGLYAEALVGHNRSRRLELRKEAQMDQFYTYERFAQWVQCELAAENDSSFVVRVLKRVVSEIRDIKDHKEFIAAHREPDTTGDADWDRVIRAAAEMTYSERFPGESPGWSAEISEPPEAWFYPTSRPSRFVFNLERTPMSFRKRSICLGEGNLRTAKDHDRPWI